MVFFKIKMASRKFGFLFLGLERDGISMVIAGAITNYFYSTPVNETINLWGREGEEGGIFTRKKYLDFDGRWREKNVRN